MKKQLFTNTSSSSSVIDCSPGWNDVLSNEELSGLTDPTRFGGGFELGGGWVTYNNINQT